MEFNPIGLDGMEFIEYCGPESSKLIKLFSQLGMIQVAKHKTKNISLFRQNEINFLLNEDTGNFAEQFGKSHGLSICSTGFRVKNAKQALENAVKRGAKAYTDESQKSYPYPAIWGIGNSLVYFIDDYNSSSDMFEKNFTYTSANKKPVGKGLTEIDHMTNNVPKGELDKWAKFYEEIFNFKEIRFFDIKGSQTGLLSRAMRSPCKKITIPINEPTDTKSQIQEYLDEYKGSGIQHVALATNDICKTVSSLREDGIPVLGIPDTYYEVLLDRVPVVKEDVKTLSKLQILADGDSEGYLLQLFTQNLIGPIFFEFIQRKNHHGFGEGNFQALFEAIERDQKRRGVL